ncbi:hypothetical protein FRC07_010211 [Ceratobasidium sp. 392]|nr:hypothetical protein FRC07_010211 [Ceratobasidium sp. 392]
MFGVPRAVEYEMDKDTEELGVMMDYATDEKVKQRILFSGARVEFQASARAAFHFQKIFGVSDFLGTGMTKIPVGGKKPSEPSNDNSYGAVELKVHGNTFVVAPGGMFLVPRDHAEESSPLCREAGSSDEGNQTEANVVLTR